MNLAASTVVRAIDGSAQRAFVDAAQSVAASASLLSPTAGGKPMRVRVTNAGAVGWVADAKGYRYSPAHPETGRPWPPIPEVFLELADEDEPVHRTRLVSGDVTLLAGPTRHYLHTIERIEPALGLLYPSPLPRPGRLAISLRCAA